MTDYYSDDDALANLFSRTFPPNQSLIHSENNDPQNINMATNISVRDYLDLIPVFDGDVSKLPNFIDTCEKVYTMLITDNNAARVQFLMLHFRNKIVGKAAEVIAAREFNTFPELKALLLNTFGDQRNEESLLNDLMMLTQNHNESATQFADRVISLRSLLLSKIQVSTLSPALRSEKNALYNKMALRTYLSGLNAHLSHLLRCKQPQSLEDAINKVVEEENMAYNRQQKLGPRSNFQNANLTPLKTSQVPHGNFRYIPMPSTSQRAPPPQINRPAPNIPHRVPNLFNQRYPQPFFQQRQFQNPPNFPRQAFPNFPRQTFPNFPRQTVPNFPSFPNFQNRQNPPHQQNFQSQQFSQNNQNPQRPNFPRHQEQSYPQPMDTSSGNTRQTRNTQRPSAPPRFTFQELHCQEVPENIHYDEYYDEEPYYHENECYSEEYYPEFQENSNEDENFPIPASETNITTTNIPMMKMKNPMNTKTQ